MRSPPIHLHELLTGWQTSPSALVSLALTVAVAAAYVAGARRLSQRGRRWSRWRTASFLAGALLVVVAVDSGLAAYDDSRFAMHMVQHELLMNAAPILIVLGAPVTLALQALPRRGQVRLLWFLHTPVVRFLTNPLFVVAMATVTMLGFFLTGFYQLSLEHPLLHDFTHLHFLITGSLYWAVVVGVDPLPNRPSFPMRLGMLAVEIPVGTIVGLSLTQASVSIAPLFHTVLDTRQGGAIEWIVAELTTLGAMGVLLMQWLRADEREAVRSDRRADRRMAERVSAGGAPDARVVTPTATANGPRTEDDGTPRAPAVRRVTVQDGRLVPAEDGASGS